MSDDLILEKFLPYRLSVTSHSISTNIARIYEKRFGVSIPEWRVIAILGRFPGLSAVEVAERTLMDKVAVSRAIAAMIEMGYLERKTSETDGRRSQLFLTPAGREVYEMIVPMALGEEQELSGSLTEEERRELDRLMVKLAEAASPDRPLW